MSMRTDGAGVDNGILTADRRDTLTWETEESVNAAGQSKHQGRNPSDAGKDWSHLDDVDGKEEDIGDCENK